MKLIFKMMVFLGVILVLTATGYKYSDPIIFPFQGQSEHQRKVDTQYCEKWIKQETGINFDYLKAKLNRTSDNITRAMTEKYPASGQRRIRHQENLNREMIKHEKLQKEYDEYISVLRTCMSSKGYTVQ